ncbi:MULTISPECIES: hypothetical protein [Brevibacillus]|uniref:hypothetical protein n=1 Tax=Brevibacillus TaxID=55080 RepID=UPI0004687900|nr:hypothetical protein [Brevibacillus borstelensis]
MAIRDWHFKHGAALAIIINEREYQSITKLDEHTQSEYLLNNNTGLYIKHASEDEDHDNKWKFWFTPIHQEQVQAMFDRFGERAYIVLVCGNDWVCVINYHDYKNCIDENFEENEWLEVTRPEGGGYRVRGKLGLLGRVVPKGDFPRVLFQRSTQRV